MQYTLDQLCRGVGNPKIQSTIKKCSEIRKNHYYAKQGYTPSKDYRWLGEIPYWVKFHPEFSKYFDSEMDEHERRKNLYAFLRKYGKGFQVVDRL